MEPIRFASATAEERHAALTAAAGYPLLLGETTARAVIVGSPDAGACPARSATIPDPLQAIYDAGTGCTAPGGFVYAGRLRVAGDLDAPPVSLEFEAFRLDGPASATRLALHGSLERGAPAAEGAYLTRELIRFSLGTEVAVSIVAACDATGLCVTDDDHVARGAIPEVGTFDVAFARRGAGAGQWAGWIELHGEDVLRLDLDAPRDADGCWPYTIDGAPAGRWCGSMPR
jgi:hypothetical protein